MRNYPDMKKFLIIANDDQVRWWLRGHLGHVLPDSSSHEIPPDDKFNDEAKRLAEFDKFTNMVSHSIVLTAPPPTDDGTSIYDTLRIEPFHFVILITTGTVHKSHVVSIVKHYLGKIGSFGVYDPDWPDNGHLFQAVPPNTMYSDIVTLVQREGRRES